MRSVQKKKNCRSARSADRSTISELSIIKAYKLQWRRGKTARCNGRQPRLLFFLKKRQSLCAAAPVPALLASTSTSAPPACPVSRRPPLRLPQAQARSHAAASCDEQSPLSTVYWLMVFSSLLTILQHRTLAPYRFKGCVVAEKVWI